MERSGFANIASEANAALVDAFALHLATRAAHTRSAYLRDVSTLCALCGDKSVKAISRAEIARFLATLHGGGLSGRSLARTLSAWRSFFRLDRKSVV